jgi:hypothetical protein
VSTYGLPGWQQAGQGLAAVAGKGLAACTAALAALRPAAKPLHPHGVVLPGTVTRFGGGRRSGVAWIDEPGISACTVRLSRAVGTPSALPDVHGTGVRVLLQSGGHADVLLATTGLGRLTRFALRPTRLPWSGPSTTLLPFRSPDGPLLLATRPVGSGRADLLWARPTGRWTLFGELVLGPGDETDSPMSFDPVTHPLPGLPAYEWTRRLRLPAYARARRSRGEH